MIGLGSDKKEQILLCFEKDIIQKYIFRMCDGGTVEYLRDLVCHKEALQVEGIEKSPPKNRACVHSEQKRVVSSFCQSIDAVKETLTG